MARHTQIFALLFQADGSVSASVEDGSLEADIRVPNTEAGLASLLEWMTERSYQEREPLLCCSATEGGEVSGLIFEELIASDQVRRFLMAKPFYLNFATTEALDSSSAATLLRAARAHAPGVMRVA
jgi:hypothetical protein